MSYLIHDHLKIQVFDEFGHEISNWLSIFSSFTNDDEGMSCFPMAMHGWHVLQVSFPMVWYVILSLLELHCIHKLSYKQFQVCK